MKPLVPVLFLACVLAILAAGCATTVPAGTATPATSNPPVTPAPSAPIAATASPSATSLSIIASPQRYTPLMSSTVGIGLTVSPVGFDRANATYQWSATYGEFLSWSPPDYTVVTLSPTPTTHGEKIFWSFTGKTRSPDTPVTITVVAKDPSGAVLGTSQLTLDWDGDYTVVVRGS
ncbi:MAG TPA: hypothetical protein VEI81_05710 [Methanoregula sp.]|nr:hypothetical protein [Methanoregula sp.]